jgi:hypothetical protein
VYSCCFELDADHVPLHVLVFSLKLREEPVLRSVGVFPKAKVDDVVEELVLFKGESGKILVFAVSLCSCLATELCEGYDTDFTRLTDALVDLHHPEEGATHGLKNDFVVEVSVFTVLHVCHVTNAKHEVEAYCNCNVGHLSHQSVTLKKGVAEPVDYLEGDGVLEVL